MTGNWNPVPIDAFLWGWELVFDWEGGGRRVRLWGGGEELYRWRYTPSLTELFEVCDRLIKEGVR